MTQEQLNETYMKRCLDLASTALGNAAPNPLVGSVIVHEGRVIGEGYHHYAGGPHAEVNAVQSVANKDLLRESVLYVNLEPCSHMGKTPPCADMIINCGIPKVVTGMIDPNPVVAGNGLKKLRDAGVSVLNGILEEQCANINKRFITFHLHKRPYVILKWAQTSDGFIDILRDDPAIMQPTWISNEISRMLVHKWRSEEQAILIGTNTAMMDNPKLNVREWSGRSPIRLIIDRNLRLRKDLNIFNNQSPTIIFNALTNRQEDNTRYVRLDFNEHVIAQMLSWLYENNIQSVIVEGGRMMLEGFITGNFWDEARVFKGTRKFGAGLSAPEITRVKPDEFFIREDVLLIYRNTQQYC